MFGGIAVGVASVVKPNAAAQGRPVDARRSDSKLRRRDVRRPR